MTIARLLDIGAAAAAAIEARGPIVALESTIITHGMPFPQNFETALKLEDAVRAQGATPATIVTTSSPPGGRVFRER